MYTVQCTMYTVDVQLYGQSSFMTLFIMVWSQWFGFVRKFEMLRTNTISLM